MIRDPEVMELRTELEQLGVVVAPHSDHLCVRLPLFASVRVRVDDQRRLDCQAMLGPLPRTAAVLLGTTLLTAATACLLYFTGPSPAALTAAFLAIMAGLGSGWCFVLTESCVTRIQLLWAAHMRERERPGIARQSSFPTLRAIDVPTPDVSPPQRLPVERKR